MKKLSAFIFFAMAAFGAEQGATVGIGTIIKMEPYKGVKNQTFVLPYIDARYGALYIKGLEAGAQFNKGGVSTEIFAKARLDGYKPDDSDELKGMEEKKKAIDGGVKLSYQYANIGKFSIGALTDISSTHKGYELSAEYSRGHFFENSMFAPFASVKYQDKKLSNYYYGVKDTEATPQRAAYSLSSTLNYELGARYMYFINKKSTIIAVATYTFLDDKIDKSPIAGKGGIGKLAVFYGYKF